MKAIYSINSMKIVTIKNGDEYASFAPDQKDTLKDYAPELYNEISKIWTPEVIELWRENNKLKEV